MLGLIVASENMIGVGRLISRTKIRQVVGDFKGSFSPSLIFVVLLTEVQL